nr:DUF502 domain-containing protein [Candidatus Coxiella mudrowiae]
MLARTPLVRSIYMTVKQVIHAFFNPKVNLFEKWY